MTKPDSLPEEEFADFDARIDEVMDKLNNLQLGREIIFDELQELKELKGKLSKKNLLQLLKGKLAEMAIDGILTRENFETIYETITHQHIRLRWP